MTGSVNGFVAGDTLASATTGKLTWSTTFGLGGGIMPGTYAIDGGRLSAKNYTFVQAAGNAKALTVQFFSKNELVASSFFQCGIFRCDTVIF